MLDPIKRNLTLMTDLYQLTMMNGYQRYDMKDMLAVYDMFYRASGPISAYAICVGLEQVVDYIQNLHFDDADIEYLRSLHIFDEEFFQSLPIPGRTIFAVNPKNNERWDNL